MSSAPSNGASMSDINQCSRVFYHKPSSNGKQLNKDPRNKREKNIRARSFKDSVGFQNTSPPTLRSNINNPFEDFKGRNFKHESLIVN
jgi:hypothetical protein